MKIKTTFIIFLIVALSLNAQDYTITTTTGTYTDLVNSTSLNNDAPWDDPEFLIPIGFNFQYFNTTISQIYIDDCTFGAGLKPNPVDNVNSQILTAYGADIIDRGYDFNNTTATTGALSNISYKLEGAPGSRILKIEWKNVGFHSDIEDNGISTDFTNFQLWLFEGSNAIEIHFGPNSITQPDLAYDAETGTSIEFANSYNCNTETLSGNASVVNGTPTNPNIISSSLLDDNFIDGTIPNGTIYRFVNSSLSTSEFNLNPKITIYPNPSSDFITISGIETTKTYSIYDALGRIIEKNKTIQNKTINITGYKNGLYYIALENTKPIKFIKQ